MLGGASIKPLKVVHVVTGLGLGGAETVLSRIIAGSPNITHEVITLGDRQWYSDVLEAQGVTVRHMKMRGASIAGLWRLRRAVRESGADVVQCWMYRANLLGGLVGRSLSLPTIWNIRMSSPEFLGLGSRAIAHVGGRTERWLADFVISCSERSYEAHRPYGFGHSPGEVIANGYDSADSPAGDADRSAIRAEIGVAKDRFLIGGVMRWHPQKDIPTLLAAVRLLLDRKLPIACVLLGGGLDAGNGEFMAAVAAAGCGEAIIPLGKRSDVSKLAGAMDLHVLSSVAEGFPNAVAETMLAGTPNVVTDVGDAALIVGDTGWVVPMRDPGRIADAVAAACDEQQHRPERWAKRRSDARARIVDNFSMSRMITAYEDVWMRIGRNHPTAGQDAARG